MATLQKPFDVGFMKPLMIRNFPKQYPDLAGVQRVDVLLAECPKCKQKTFWMYEITENDQVKHLPCWTQCNTCGNQELSKQVTEEMQTKRIEQFISKWYCLSDDEKFGFKNYDAYSKVTAEAKDRIISYTQLFSQNSLGDEKNLLIQGSPGTGKTHLTKALARTLKARGFKVGFLTAEMLFQKFKSTFDTKIPIQRIFDEMKLLDILIIDDVGAEATKVDQEASWSVSMWTKIMDTREGLPSVWTSNHDEEKLARVVGERANSRMYKNTRFIDMFTEDYRKRGAIHG